MIGPRTMRLCPNTLGAGQDMNILTLPIYQLVGATSHSRCTGTEAFHNTGRL